jgi:hypothetical protein
MNRKLSVVVFYTDCKTLYLKWKRQKFYKKPSRRIHQNILLAFNMNLGYNETAFVMQILLQPGRQNLRNLIRLYRPMWLHIIDSLLLN